MVGRPLSDLFPRTDAPIGDEVLRVEDLALAGKQASRHASDRCPFTAPRRDPRRRRVDGCRANRVARGAVRRPRPSPRERPATSTATSGGSTRRRRRSMPAWRSSPRTARRELDHRDVGQAQRHARRCAASCASTSCAGAEDAAVQRSITELQIKTPSASAAVETLSGGNQQKVALAKCL